MVLVSQKSFPKLAKAGRGRLFKTVQTAELIPTKVLWWPWLPGAVLRGPLQWGLNRNHLCFPHPAVNPGQMSTTVPVGERLPIDGSPCGFYSFTGTLTKSILACRN